MTTPNTAAPKVWSNPSLLKSFKNPSTSGTELNFKTDELTFLGRSGQPDHAEVEITLYPAQTVIELKSLKEYFVDFRMRVISYERILEVVYQDLLSTYQPVRLRLTMTFNTRGGIRSRDIIDSDWKIRGGKEEFKDWIGGSRDW